MQELKSCLNIPARNGIDNLSPAPPTAFRSSFRSSTSFSSSMDARNISIEKPRNSSDLSEGSCAPIPSNEAWTARGPKEVEGGAGFRRPSRDDLQSPQILAHPSDASREGQPSLQPAQTSDHDIGLLPIPHRRKSTAEAGAIVTAAVIEHGVTPPRLPLDSWPCAHDETAIHGHADDDLMGAHARAASQDIHVPIHRPSHDTLSSRALPVQGHQNSSQDAVESELQAEARRGDANSGQLGVTEANMQPAAVVHTLGQVAISNIHSTSNFVWLDESRPEPGPPRLPPSMLVVGQG